MFLLAVPPSFPAVSAIRITSTNVIVRIIPSATGDTPITYQLFYRSGTAGDYISAGLPITIVGQNQTLSSLQPDTLYNVFVKATNHGGGADSRPIFVRTKPQGIRFT